MASWSSADFKVTALSVVRGSFALFINTLHHIKYIHTYIYTYIIPSISPDLDPRPPIYAMQKRIKQRRPRSQEIMIHIQKIWGFEGLKVHCGCNIDKLYMLWPCRTDRTECRMRYFWTQGGQLKFPLSNCGQRYAASYRAIQRDFFFCMGSRHGRAQYHWIN